MSALKVFGMLGTVTVVGIVAVSYFMPTTTAPIVPTAPVNSGSSKPASDGWLTQLPDGSQEILSQEMILYKGTKRYGSATAILTDQQTIFLRARDGRYMSLSKMDWVSNFQSLGLVLVVPDFASEQDFENFVREQITDRRILMASALCKREILVFIDDKGPLTAGEGDGGSESDDHAIVNACQYLNRPENEVLLPGQHGLHAEPVESAPK